MLNLSSPYLFLSFLLSVTTIIISIFLFAIHIPYGENMRRYNISRYILASAYAILGIFNCSKIFKSSVYINLDLVHTFTLISASYQALLFTFTLFVLIQPLYVTFKRVSIQFGVISLVFIFLLALLFNISSSLYSYFYYAVSIIYVFQLIYYIFLFRKKYTQCLKQLEDYYNEDEDNRLRWVEVCFYMALSIGIMALCCTYLSLFYCNYFVAAFIVFYILFAIKYCNYPSKFGYIIAAVFSENENSDNTVSLLELDINETQILQPLSIKEQKLQQALDKWVEEKKFQYDDISRDDIAISLGTDRNFLAYFFHNRMQIEFRIWRTQLRIEEAKCLLLKYPDLSISNIGQKVGISDRSNFQKKFIELVGISPKDWRNRNHKN